MDVYYGYMNPYIDLRFQLIGRPRTCIVLAYMCNCPFQKENLVAAESVLWGSCIYCKRLEANRVRKASSKH